MNNPFDACWHRVERAEEHRSAATNRWNEFIDGHPWETETIHEGNGTFRIEVTQTEPTPSELSILIGEWLYNLRCALDYAVYATAIFDSGGQDPPPMHNQLEFPCCFDEDAYERNAYRLKHLKPEHRDDIIRFMQPYGHPDPDTSALGWLHKLARIDRHRRLTVMTAYMAEQRPKVRAPEGTTVQFDLGDRVLVDGRGVVCRFTVTGWQEGMFIQANPGTGIDPEIAEWSTSPFWRTVPYNERFRMLWGAVLSTIVPLEYSCTGTSRHQDLLAEDYRAEIDARRT